MDSSASIRSASRQPTEYSSDTASTFSSQKSHDSVHESIPSQTSHAYSLNTTSDVSGTAFPKEMTELVELVVSLSERCNSLETMNRDIRGELELLRQYQSFDDGTALVHPPQTSLVPYASSHSSEDGPNTAPDSSSDDDIQGKIDIVSEILAEFNTRIESISERQEEMKALMDELRQRQDTTNASFERKCHDQTAIKGRVGYLEKEMKSVRSDLESSMGTKSATQCSCTTSDSEKQEALMQEMGKLRLRVKNLETQVNQPKPKVEGNQGNTASLAQGASHDASKIKVVETHLVKLHRTVAKIRLHARNIQVIDETATKLGLYTLFHQLSALMDHDDDQALWREGPFQATTTDAFLLRDHVLCRLAVFDKYGDALQEARAAKDDLDL